MGRGVDGVFSLKFQWSWSLEFGALSGRHDRFRLPPGAKVKHRHPHRDAVGHLLEDHAVLAICEFAVDFDAAIDRARVHDDRLGLSHEARVLFRPNMLVYSPSEGNRPAAWRSC